MTFRLLISSKITLKNKFNRVTSDTKGILLVYDYSKSKSFTDLSKWIQTIDENAPFGACTSLIGYRLNTEDKRAISTSQGEKMALEHSMNFCEISEPKDFDSLRIVLAKVS